MVLLTSCMKQESRGCLRGTQGLALLFSVAYFLFRAGHNLAEQSYKRSTKSRIQGSLMSLQFHTCCTACPGTSRGEGTINFLPHSWNWSCCPLHEPKQSWERTDVITPQRKENLFLNGEPLCAGTAGQLLLALRLMAFRMRAITSSLFVVPGRCPSQHQAGLGWVELGRVWIILTLLGYDRFGNPVVCVTQNKKN